MKKIKSENFIANIGLKDIVGRGLITNTNIALIELIKNAKDAGSRKVDLIFENSDDFSNKNARIIIKDFGKGMTHEELKYKWLNMAYSAKKHQLNDQGKAYAGNKGIGRFSCDRLGKNLDMYTLANENQGYRLSVNWEKFEIDDIDKKISDPEIEFYELTKDEINEIYGTKNITSGTCLIISNLRSNWGFVELKNLKRELEKFVIRPTSENDAEKFDIYLSANFLNKKETEEINVKIENKIFHELDFRTTSITSEITKNGEFIKTTLSHNAVDIFTTTEKNIYPKLKNIKIKLFYMGRAQKIFLSRRIGYDYRAHNDFGSVFLFLNGFRVYPYGEEANDWLKLDQRKAQGYSRYLGTRELLGYVSIDDSENLFNPISAREGLENNAAFQQLSDLEKIHPLNDYGYISKVFRKLEKFVIDGLKWDKTKINYSQKILETMDEKDVQFEDLDKELLDSLAPLITYGIKKENISNITLNEEYFKSAAIKEAEAITRFHDEIKNTINLDKVENFSQLDKLMPEIKKRLEEEEAARLEAEQRAEEAEAARLEAEQRAEEAEEKIEEQQRTIEQIESENLFHKANASQDAKALRNLIHKIVIDTNGIKNKIAAFRYKKDKKTLEDADIEKYFKTISYLSESILKVAELARSRNYKMKTGNTNVELISFIKNYLFLLTETKVFDEIKIIDNIDASLVFNKEIKPLELFIVFDNFINNSIKADAKEIIFSIQKAEELILNISDNGNGITPSTDKSKIFERGYTTTSGAGLGLSHAKEIINKLNWEIKLVDSNSKGFKLEVKIR